MSLIDWYETISLDRDARQILGLAMRSVTPTSSWARSTRLAEGTFALSSGIPDIPPEIEAKMLDITARDGANHQARRSNVTTAHL
jgi:hypothetical protein